MVYLMWPFLMLVLHVLPRTLFILPLLLATPLPLCHRDAFMDPAAYILPKNKIMGCGLPLSRLYLLSQFNAVLTIDTSRLDTFYAQTKNKVVVSICQPPDTLKNVWRDDISVLKPSPWNVETCNQAEINLHSRLISDKSFETTLIRNLNLPDRCAFSVEFTPSVPGNYYLEVVNTWLAASTDPNPLSANPKAGRWTGTALARKTVTC